MLDFADQVVLVVGASGGIGTVVSKLFLEQGAQVINCACDYPQSFTACRDIGENPINSKLDITKREQVEQVIAEIISGFGHLDVVVNCAGILHAKVFLEISEQEWDQLFAVNLKGMFFVCQAAARRMIAQKSGVIVNVASISGQVGGVMAGADYVASKAGVIGLTKSLAKFCAPYGVRANAVAPGAVETEMLNVYRELTGASQFEASARAVPLQRWARPEEIAAGILFLASPQSSYITGTCLNINGGEYMG